MEVGESGPAGNCSLQAHGGSHNPISPTVTQTHSRPTRELQTSSPSVMVTPSSLPWRRSPTSPHSPAPADSQRGPFKSGSGPFTLCLHNRAGPYHSRPEERGGAARRGEAKGRCWRGAPPPQAVNESGARGRRLAPPHLPPRRQNLVRPSECSVRGRAAAGSVRGAARSPLGSCIPRWVTSAAAAPMFSPSQEEHCAPNKEPVKYGELVVLG